MNSLKEILDGNVKLYKVLEKKDAHFLKDGSVLFGSFRKYRLMETKWIGDPFEGRVAHVINAMNTNHVAGGLEDGYWVVRNPNDPRQILLKARAGPRSNNILKNVTFLGSLPNLYILCVSIGPIELIKDGWNRYPEANYADPAIFEITDVSDFCRHVLESSTLELDGVTFKTTEKFSQLIDFGVVEYKRVVHPFSGEISENPSPFSKDLKFSWQREARFLLKPLVDNMPDSVSIKVDSKYFREVET